MKAPATKKQPTIYQVAEKAGVSVPTVSRVLTGAQHVSDEKRALVVAAIEALNFRPSAAARALVARSHNLVAVLARDTSHFGYAETIRGVEERARAVGMSVIIAVVKSDTTDDVDRAVELVMNQAIAGVVVLKFDSAGAAALGRIPKDVPTVAISGLREKGISQAVFAEADAADALVTHLLDLGHATVHHVRVPPSRREDGRTTGWRRALKRAGRTPPPLIDATWEPESGRLIGNEIASWKDVSAVFCGNDEIAMGLIRGLTEQGKSIPADVSVVGFDDHPLAAMWEPPLTTVRQDFADLGARAFTMLEDILGGSTRVRYSSELPALKIRGSSGPPPGAA
jgi:DNA-binding LacI/PurR family transcriptional regulator